MTKNQINALTSIKKNGRIIAAMVGSIGFVYRWQNEGVEDDVPKAITIKSLINKSLLFYKSHKSHQVIGELLITHCTKDWVEDSPAKLNEKLKALGG